MIGRVLHLALGLACLVAVGPARAGGIGPCTEPFAFRSAVNVYVLEDAERDAPQDLRDVRKRLAWLVKLDTLFHDSYGSLGVHFLWQPPEMAPCTLDSVVQLATRALPPGGAAAFVDQRVYRKDKQVLLQSYLRFLRVDAEKREKLDTVEFAPSGGQPAFSEFLPAQRVAFPPRRLTTDVLIEIERAFAEGSLLYPEPRPGSAGTRLPLSAEQPLPFRVTEARSDGWMLIDTTFGPRLRGWVRADPKVSARLRSLLPELRFLEGAVGYLSYLQARDGRVLNRDVAPRIARRAREVLARYVEAAGLDKDSGSSGSSEALAETLRAAMAFDDPADAAAILPSLVTAVQRSLPDSRLRGVLGITRLATCCRELSLPDDPLRRAVRVVELSGALNDFQGALAIDPGNVRALANLEAIYTMLGRAATFPLATQAPEDAPAPLRDAYTRALARLPATSAEFSTRRTEIQMLRAVLPSGRRS